MRIQDASCKPNRVLSADNEELSLGICGETNILRHVALGLAFPSCPAPCTFLREGEGDESHFSTNKPKRAHCGIQKSTFLPGCESEKHTKKLEQ